MSELLRLQTSQFELSVWCSSITKQQRLHHSTLVKRGKGYHEISKEPHEVEEELCRAPVIRFSPPLSVNEVSILGLEQPKPIQPLEYLKLCEPLFFENVQYQFEWIFFEPVEAADLIHRSQIINESFRFSKAVYLNNRSTPSRLTGSINTGNDVGWMRLPLNFVIAGQQYQSQIAFEVLPTKMDLKNDLQAMYQSIDQEFPLWRFSMVEKTEQDVAKSQHRGHFPLLWLANFGNLRKDFEQGLKVITEAPHSRLQPQVSYSKADRLKGKLSYRLGEKVQENFTNGLYDKRYLVEKKQLSVDTPENRYIKMVVSQSKKYLFEFEAKLRQSNLVPDKQRLSEAFFNELQSWQRPLKKVLNQSFFNEVGGYCGLNRESLVLQQKTGYSAVYRVWQELKFYLDVFANQSSVSMKSVAEIYEIWCFLELRNILIDELGFQDKTSERPVLELNEFFEYRLKDGFAGAFHFERSDGVKIRLAHEPKFTKKGKSIRSYLVSQEPDIVLEVTLPPPANKRFVWLFDAKYRIKSEQNRFDEESFDSKDYVPDDAINQMHRYRDALIRITQDNPTANPYKSRPVFGAFALYPGYFDQEHTSNPYAEAIKEISIGAFALLPGADGNSGHRWLLNFLSEQIGNKPSQPTTYSTAAIEERLYVQDAARIPYHGMKQVLYPDLTMTASLGSSDNRSDEYFKAFIDGSARYYHMPQATFKLKFREHVVEEVRFLALAFVDDSKCLSIHKVWPVREVQLLPRCDITREQSGKSSDSSELYLLFELGYPLNLRHPVQNVIQGSFRESMKLTTLTLLEKAEEFSVVETVYKEMWL